MARVRKYMNATNGWEQTAKATAANAADLPHLEIPLGRLNGLIDHVRSLNAQHGLLAAAKQETSQKLQKALQEGDTLVDFIRTGVRERYGYRSEKLVEFGMQPLRVRPRTAKVKPPEEPPATPNPTSTPETTK